jgi:hypothetical protein
VVTIYQAVFKFGESRDSKSSWTINFPSAEARQEYANGAEVYWYHFIEWDNWHEWKRGGAWNATATPGPADRINIPPEVTEADRW